MSLVHVVAAPTGMAHANEAAEARLASLEFGTKAAEQADGAVRVLGAGQPVPLLAAAHPRGGSAVEASAVEKRRVVTNTGDRLMLVFTEPEAQDYWLRPGESVEVRAEVASEEDDFELEDTPRGVTVWPSRGMEYISTWAGGVELACGHQRPPGSW